MPRAWCHADAGPSVAAEPIPPAPCHARAAADADPEAAEARLLLRPPREAAAPFTPPDREGAASTRSARTTARVHALARPSPAPRLSRLFRAAIHWRQALSRSLRIIRGRRAQFRGAVWKGPRQRAVHPIGP